MPPIRHIVYECIPGAYAGGVQKMVFELASAQRRLGQDVEVWTVDADRAGQTELHGALPIRYFSPRLRLRLYPFPGAERGVIDPAQGCRRARAQHLPSAEP